MAEANEPALLILSDQAGNGASNDNTVFGWRSLSGLMSTVLTRLSHLTSSFSLLSHRHQFANPSPLPPPVRRRLYHNGPGRSLRAKRFGHSALQGPRLAIRPQPCRFGWSVRSHPLASSRHSGQQSGAVRSGHNQSLSPCHCCTAVKPFNRPDCSPTPQRRSGRV